MGKRLDTFVNAVILITCGVMLSTYAVRVWTSYRIASAPHEDAQVRVGDKIPSLAESATNGHKTLVLFWRVGCSYCAASTPFYQRLSESLHKHGQFDLVVVTTDDQHAASDVLRAEAISPLRIISVSPEQQRSQYKVFGTPTLVVLDLDGAVEKVWIGRLQNSDEKAVLQLVSTPHNLAVKVTNQAVPAVDHAR